MSIMHSVSKLVSAANRHGVFVGYPDSSSVTLPESTANALRSVLPEIDRPLVLEEMNSVEAARLASALNRSADTRKEQHASQ